MIRKAISLLALGQAAEEEIAAPFFRDETRRTIGHVDEHIVLEQLNRPPIAELHGPPEPVCPGFHTFDGTLSSDPDDRGLMRTDVQTYTWRLDGHLLGGERGNLVTLWVGDSGVHNVELEVADSFGATARASWALEVEDVDPPKASLELHSGFDDPDFVHVDAKLDVEDSCGGAVESRLVSVVPVDDGCGGEGSPGSVLEAALGTDDRRFRLARQACGARARTYLVTYEVRDSAGNVGRVQGTVAAGWRN